jgi:tRNA-dependent cyclodipeptide synthase
MSPGNGYFKDEEVRYLLKTVVEQYGKTAILIADIPAISTYVALGYPTNRARRDKALPQGNNLKNRTRRIMEELGYTTEQVRIIEWEEEIENNKEYKRTYDNVLHLYKTNFAFEKSADETTKGVLKHSEKSISDMDAAVKIGVHYLLSEIAFLEFTPRYLKTEKVTYVYHKNWPVYEDYISGKFDGVQKLHVDFLLLENPNETFKTISTESGDGVMRAAFYNYANAFQYNSETKEFSGIFFEVFQRIADIQGWNIEWTEETGYGVIQEGLKNKRFDIFASAVWPTPEREQEAGFSISLYMSNAYVWTREGESVDLASPNIRVVIKEGDISDYIASEDFGTARVVRVPQLAPVDEILRFVSEDKGDITFVEEFVAEEFNKISKVKLVKASEKPIRQFGNTFMIRKDDVELKKVLDTEIQNLIDSGVVGELIEKYK